MLVLTLIVLYVIATGLYFLTMVATRFSASSATAAALAVLSSASHASADDAASPGHLAIPLQHLSGGYDTSDAPWAGESVLVKRQTTANASIQINAGASSYLGNVSLGTPAQVISLIVDTGSPLLWVNAANVTNFTPGSTRASSSRSSICSSASCFNPNSSSTNTVPSNSTVFDIQYADGTQAIGRTVEDNGVFQGLSDTSLEFGLVEYVYNPVQGDPLSGIIGLSPPSTVISYPNLTAALQGSTRTARTFSPVPVLDQLVNAGKISTPAFSIYLDNRGGGELTIGGVDTSRYTGPLTILPIISTEQGPAYSVNLNGAGANGQSSTVTRISNLQVILDSGTTATYVPSSLLSALASSLNGVAINYSSGTTILGVPCSAIGNGQTIDFYFDNNAVIRVLTQLLYTETLPAAQSARYGGLSGQDTCILGIFGLGSSSDNIYLLGDSFLRSAYVVFNYPQNQVAIAQSTYGRTGGSISAISAGRFGIPNAVYNSSSPGARSSAALPSLASVIALNSLGSNPRTSVGTGTITGATVATGQTSSTARSDAAAGPVQGLSVVKTIGVALGVQALLALVLF